MKERYNVKKVARWHAARIENEIQPKNNIKFNNDFNRTFYNDAIILYDYMVKENINYDENQVNEFFDYYFGDYSESDKKSFDIGIQFEQRRIKYNPEEEIFVDYENSIVIAFKEFLGNKKSRR